MNIRELISQREDVVREHFEVDLHRHITIRIPYIEPGQTYGNLSIFSMYPRINSIDITYQDWLDYLKIKEFNKDFEDIINEKI